MSFSGSRRWASPALCGCELILDAQWPELPEADGLENRHPIPYTIKSVSLGSVCAEHTTWLSDPLPVDPWFGCKGYMSVPESPSEAENLYIHLFQLTGQKCKHDCGCVTYTCESRTGSAGREVRHPKFSKVCRGCKAKGKS